jgi:acetyltransferase-like isoleucine patch superfamily enzyme
MPVGSRTIQKGGIGMSLYARLAPAWRRSWFILRLRLQALRTGTHLELDLAKNCRVGKGLKILLQGGHCKITMRERSHLGERVHIELRGGELYMGPRTEIRAEAIAHISGKLHLEEACGFSLRCIVHCGSSIEVGKYSVVGEYASVMDGEHVHIQTDDYWFYGDPQAKTVLKPVKIGKGAYIGAKTTIAMGVEIGDFSRIGANSLVLRSIEPHRLAVGVPARPIMELE